MAEEALCSKHGLCLCHTWKASERLDMPDLAFQKSIQIAIFRSLNALGLVAFFTKPPRRNLKCGGFTDVEAS